MAACWGTVRSAADSDCASVAEKHDDAASVAAGAHAYVTDRGGSGANASRAAIAADRWEASQYTDALFDQTTGTGISRAEVAEVPFTAFAAGKKTDQVLRQAGARPGSRTAA